MTRHRPDRLPRLPRAGVVGLLAFSGLAVAAGGALAAGLPTTSAGLASGTAAVSRCGDLSAARAGYAVSAGAVTEVTVTGVPTGCLGGRLTVTLVSATGAALASAGPVTVDAARVTLTGLSGGVGPAAVASVAISVVGP